jgi:hypothetical protein
MPDAGNPHLGSAATADVDQDVDNLVDRWLPTRPFEGLASGPVSTLITGRMDGHGNHLYLAEGAIA